MCVRNQLDRFNLVSDVINRVPKLGARAAYALQAIREKLLDHRHYIAEHGDDLPEIRDWRWGSERRRTRQGRHGRGQRLEQIPKEIFEMAAPRGLWQGAETG